MTIRDDIVCELRASSDGLTDAQLANRLGKRHQQVNQRCRALAHEGLVVRDNASGTIVNRWVGAEQTMTTREFPAPVSAGTPDILLVTCVKSKRSEPAAATDLYISPLFVRERAYA